MSAFEASMKLRALDRELARARSTMFNAADRLMAACERFPRWNLTIEKLHLAHEEAGRRYDAVMARMKALLVVEG